MTLEERIKSDPAFEDYLICGLRYSIQRYTYQCVSGCETFVGLLPYLTDRGVNIALDDLRLWVESQERIKAAGGRTLYLPSDDRAIRETFEKVRREAVMRKVRI